MIFKGLVDVLRENREQKPIFLGIELALRLFPLFLRIFGADGEGFDSTIGQKQHAGCKI